ncbi:MAG: hypothetical protein ACO36A_00845, partial [Ilumatobacteraceae bacterium]
MYDAVFSALMTLTGLTFAALGLLLERRERHWIRHSKMWEALRFRSLLAVAVFVVATSTVILLRIDSNDEAFTRWWLLTILLFVCSLGSLAHTLVRTRRLVEPTAILERLRRRHFNQHTIVKSPEVSVGAYMEHIKELLVGTLDEGDTNVYRSTHQNGLVNPSSPPEGLEDCVPHSFRDDARIRAAGLLAVDALGEAKAQFDAGSGRRTVNIICADTIFAILEAWVALDVLAINDASHRQAAEAAREDVVHKGCEVVVKSLEAALGTSNPSKSLVEKLEKSLRVALPLVARDAELDAVKRVAQAAERAISSGFADEASGPLEIVLARVIAAQGKRRSELLGPTVKCIPALLAARNSLSINFDDLFRLIVADHSSMVTLLGGIQKMDARSCLSVLEQLYSQDGVTRRDQVLQAFFIELIPNSFDQSSDAADHIATWLQPVADHLALTRPVNLRPLREHVIAALRQRFAPDAQVNPVFLMGISAMVKAERRAMSDKQALANQAGLFANAGSPAETGSTLPNGTLSTADHARRHQATTGSRVPASPMLWDCLNVMRDGARFARHSSSPLEFSAEVRRSVMGSLSFVVHEVDDGSVEDLAGFMFDRRLVGAIETVFDLGVLDLGDVSLYLDRFRSAAQTAVELDVGDNPEARNLRDRWNAVRLLCEA